MLRKIDTFDYDTLDKVAERLVFNMKGISKEMAEHAKVLCRKKQIKGITIFYNQKDIQMGHCYLIGDTLFAASNHVTCSVFESINKDSFVGALFYLITYEDIASTSNQLTDYYIHIWQTAYIDAARVSLKETMSEFCNNNINGMITDSFGPGFYHMKPEEVIEFYRLLRGRDIGVSLNGYMMNPVKTCTGVFLVLDQKPILPLPCEVCQLEKNCELCSYRT